MNKQWRGKRDDLLAQTTLFSTDVLYYEVDTNHIFENILKVLILRAIRIVLVKNKLITTYQ